jgi:hypothetical protein
VRWRLTCEAIFASLNTQGFHTTLMDEGDSDSRYLRVFLKPEQLWDFEQKVPRLKEIGLLVEPSDDDHDSAFAVFTIRPIPIEQLYES